MDFLVSTPHFVELFFKMLMIGNLFFFHIRLGSVFSSSTKNDVTLLKMSYSMFFPNKLGRKRFSQIK